MFFMEQKAILDCCEFNESDRTLEGFKKTIEGYKNTTEDEDIARELDFILVIANQESVDEYFENRHLGNVII